MKRLLAILLAALLLGLVPAAQAEAKTFKNCTDLRKTYKHGVSLNNSAVNRGAGPIFAPRVNAAVYRLNKKMDLDRDNIICEVVRPRPRPVAVAPTPTPTPSPTVAPTPTPTSTPTPSPTDAFAEFKLGIQGQNRVGQTLTAEYVIPPGYRFIGLQWLANRQPIPGAVAISFVPPQSLGGQRISFDLIVADSTGRTIFPRSGELATGELGTATSSAPVTQSPAPEPSDPYAEFKLGIQGLNKVGQRLTAHYVIPPGYTLAGAQWLVNREPIPDARGISLRVALPLEGQRVSFVLIVSDSTGKTIFPRSPELAPGELGAVTNSPVVTPAKASGPQDMVYENPSVASDLVDKCRIRDVSKTRGMTGAGFPEWVPMTPNKGVVKWALIPIDFQDLPGEKDFRVRVDGQMKLLSEWIETVSGGKLKVEWVILDGWATLPGKQGDYAIGQSNNVDRAPNGPKLFRHAMTAADPLFDFTGVSTVNFLLPEGQTFLQETSQGFPWDQVVREFVTNEGRIASYAIPGQFFDVPGREYWSYWAHEFGHAIGLGHVGSSRGELPPFNPWDLMGGQDGHSRELSGWLRFFGGWFDDDQVYCKDVAQVKNLNLTLIPLSEDKRGIKMAVIPLSATKAIVIESRRETKFSCPTTPGRNGVLVYVYDATLGHGENFLIPHYPSGREKQGIFPCMVSPNPDFLLRTGDKVVVEGVTIEVLVHGNLDRVLINRN